MRTIMTELFYKLGPTITFESAERVFSSNRAHISIRTALYSERNAFTPNVTKKVRGHLHDVVLANVSGSYWINTEVTIRSRVELNVLNRVRQAVLEDMRNKK